jgi:hypothetical protein
MRISLILIGLILSVTGFSQDNQAIQDAKKMLNERGEVYLSIPFQADISFTELASCLSIDHIHSGEIRAYANEKQFAAFLKLNSSFSLLTPPSLLHPFEEREGNLRSTWDFYPSWPAYLEMMEEFVTEFPEICKIDTIGYSVEGKKIMVLKISDEVYAQEAEPTVYLNATIHGDETTGYVTMLRLIDYLLNHYYLDPAIEALINSSQIYINPLANPDGAYAFSDQSVSGATRYNANFIDLNRNFPDPQDGNHPDGNPWQAETLAEMEFMLANPIHLSMNIHGGAEVVNYPWDTWSQLHADNDWYENISRTYVDTAQFYATAGLGFYMSEQNNGITNGFAWYSTDGNRQDFVNYFAYSREVTLEMSLVKMPAPSQLPLYWEASYRSLIQYIRQSHYGFQGFVYDAETISPVKAKLTILNHDQDHSEVYSDAYLGYFCRPISAGTYDLVFSAPGYHSFTVYNQSIGLNETKELVITLQRILGDEEIMQSSGFQIFPNPSEGQFQLHLNESLIGANLEIYSLEGKKVYQTQIESVQMELNPALAAGMYLLSIQGSIKKIVINP